MTSQFRNDFHILALAYLIFHYFRQTSIPSIVEIKGHFSKDMIVKRVETL